jgi:hypothetical protein
MANNQFKPDYFKVSYSIHTPSYYRPEDNELGFQSEAESMAFFADCERVFRIGGWEIEHGYAVNGKSNLYLHPQQFLGIVHAELVDAVPELIALATLFYFQQNGKRMIEEIYDITVEQQREYIAAKRPEIEAELLKAFRTSQRKLYHDPGGLLWWNIELPIGRKYGLPALDEQVNNAAGHYVSEVFASLIASGQIIQKTINGKPVYRTMMKCELSASRRKHEISSPDTPELF